jgi:hypothetical protein
MIEQRKSKTVQFWCDQIESYEKQFSTWEARGKKIVKRYKDERHQADNSKAQFNILWSNVQTLGPALYDRNPIPNIDRRFQSEDKVGTVAAQVLERCTSYFVDSDDFGNVMRQVVQDRLLPGRGIAWVRYVPNFKDDTQGLPEIQQEGAQSTDDEQIGDEAAPELYSEDCVVDYVHWCDFGHTYARTWQETRGVWRRVPMSKKELEERFGEEIAQKVPMDTGSKKDKNMPEDMKRATVYEIWDKKTKKAYWINIDCEDVLDERDDPLKLKKFFPCPQPLYATLSNDSLIPTPDYIQYQDQAKELDDLTGRIGLLTKALKVAGVYDASAPSLQRLLGEGAENILIPVEQWAVFGEKGGLKGVIDFLPMADIVGVLTSLYEAREKAKQDLYEITGISDIIRGASNPNETLGAQELKGKYAGLRLGDMQKDVARFSCDIVRIFAEIVAEHFSLETIKQLSGFQLLTAQGKQQIQMQQQMAQQQPQPGVPPMPAPPPIPEEVLKLMEEPTWDEIYALIKNETARCFRIEIETDSTIKVDQDAEKAARNEFLAAAGGFMQQAVLVQDPDLQLLLMEMLKFGVKGYKIGREMETTFDITMKKMKERAQNPEPQPDPEAEKLKAQNELDKMKLDGEMQKMQTQGQIDKMKLDGEMQKAGIDMQKMRIEQEAAPVELQLKAMDLELKKLDVVIKEKEIEARNNVPTKNPT